MSSITPMNTGSVRRALVTGGAGFIGSTLTETLIDSGWSVRVVDCFTDYYDVRQKWANIAGIRAHPNFSLIDTDLRSANIAELLDGVDVVFHQAGQPGVRLSWSSGFDAYVAHNIVATQRLLEGAKNSDIDRFVYASSSSIYGAAERYPTTELDVPSPYSPYGVTKLAGEHLCGLYAANWGVPTVALRYFTVYGPRQRPDMAFHRLIVAAIRAEAFPLYGDGSAIRDFTFVDDVVHANVLAATSDVPPGTVLNISGGASTSMREVLSTVAEIAGIQLLVDRLPAQPGDVLRTGGSSELARELLGWSAATPLFEGLRRQYAWHEAGADTT